PNLLRLEEAFPGSTGTGAAGWGYVVLNPNEFYIGPYIWSYTGDLPPGWQLPPTHDYANGPLPTPGAPLATGIYTYSLRVTDGTGRSGQKTITLKLDPPPLQIVKRTLPN